MIRFMQIRCDVESFEDLSVLCLDAHCTHNIEAFAVEPPQHLCLVEII